MRRIFLFISISFLFLFSSFTTGTHRHAYKIKTIVIDAGHGGHDTGCSGSSGKEKHVALAVALKLGKLIEEKFPDIKVIYTRTTDVFIELHERADIANRNKADLFLCIHCNSGPPSAFGVETFVMGLHKTDDNLSVARRENSSILLEKDYKQKYDGFDPHSPEANIIFSLYQNSFLAQSLKLAALIQNQFEEYAGRYNRGVKQAGFLVLYRTTMPSLLIETGFLTNRTEEKYLLTDKGQNILAASIYRAFIEYKVDMEEEDDEEVSQSKDDVAKNIPKIKPKPTKTPPPGGEDSGAASKSESSTAKTPVKELKLENDSAAIKATVRDEIKFPVEKPKEETKIVTEKPKEEIKTPVEKPKEEAKVVAEKPKEEVKTPVEKPKEEAKPVTEKPKEENKTADKPLAEVKTPELYYTIQLCAIPEVNEREMSKFKSLGEVKTLEGDDGLNRVVYGMYMNYANAINAQNTVRNKGFKDAFVTVYYKSKRITIKEAQSLKK